ESLDVPKYIKRTVAAVDLWFIQMESQFAIAGITMDSAKYHYAMSGLDFQALKEVRDIVRNPPEAGKYEKLKTELIRRLSISEEGKVRQLLAREELGDRKPSQFLRHLSNLAGTSVPESLLETIWMGGLPRNLQAILADLTDLELEKMAECADKIHKTTTGLQVACFALQTPASGIEELIRVTNAMIIELVNPINTARESSDPRAQRRTQTRSRSRSPSTGPCWYHRTFGDRATRCQSPCTRQSGNAANRL
ncbi:hypothetical protein WH47_08639, partial [Habropoda laboriosa]